MNKSIQFMKEELFFEITNMKENINKMYESFKEVMNKVESE